MPPKEPSPQTTLLILLGADSWPSATYDSSIAFKNAARNLYTYFISDPNGFHLPKSNVLDLFNSNDSVSDMLDRIRDFLISHISRKKGSSAEIRDIFVYYVGHSGITSTSSIFYLTIRRTLKDFEKSTSIAMDDLAELLKKSARFQRCILILDCCFAAAAVKFHQGSSATVILREKTIAAFKEKDQGVGSFPSRGTSFLCSSGQDATSIILPDETSTMFTYALLSALRTGDPFQKRERLSLDTVHRLTVDFLSKTYSGNIQQPELHSPAQPEGKVEDVPFFPNVAFIVEKERLRQAAQQQYLTSNYSLQSHQQQYSTSNYSLQSHQQYLPPQGFPTNPIFASGPQNIHIGSSIALVLGWSALVLSVFSMILVTLFYAHIVFPTQSTIYTASPDESYVIFAIIADICIFLGIILGLQGLKKKQARPARLLRVVAIFAIVVPLVLDMGIGIILLSELASYSLTQQLSPELVSTLQPLSNIGSYLNAGGFILLGLSLLVEKIYPRAGTVVIICGFVSILLSIFGFVGLSFIVAQNPLPSFLLVALNNVVLTIQCIVCAYILTKVGWHQFKKFIGS